MTHSLELKWDEFQRIVGVKCKDMIRSLNEAEEAYQDLLEMVASRSDQAVSDQLFSTTASAEQVAMYADGKAAMIDLHQLFQAANNIAVTQQNRMATLRRMA